MAQLPGYALVKKRSYVVRLGYNLYDFLHEAVLANQGSNVWGVQVTRPVPLQRQIWALQTMTETSRYF